MFLIVRNANIEMVVEFLNYTLYIEDFKTCCGMNYAYPFFGER